MPRKKKVNLRRKRMPRKRAYRSKRRIIPRFGFSGLYPKTRMISFPYVDHQKMDVGVYPGINQYFYSCVNLNDPVAAVGGHQPLGHDQAMELYDHFLVAGAKITVTFNSTSTSNYPVVCGIYLSDDTTVTTTSITQLLEQGKSKYRYLNIKDGTKSCTITSTYSAKKWFNITNVKDNRHQLGGSFATDSTYTGDGVYWCVFVASPEYGGATDPPEIFTNIRINYSAIVSEPKELAAS